MVVEVRKSAVERGQAGKPPITAIELMENNKVEQASTKVSTKSAKLRCEKEKIPHLTDTVASGSFFSGTRIMGRTAGDNAKCVSARANIESRPERLAADSIWVKSQSFRECRMRWDRPEN